ncbi:phage tail tape measure protein [Vibrio parahaemolyticus]|nr:phage tail tape measure protein [Vibrio parahaemolyticus]
MSISKQSNGYALELLVGIQDEFSGKSKAIEQETKRLGKEVEELQKTTGDVTKFKKAQKALEELQDQQKQNTSAVEKHKAALGQLDKQSKESAQESKRLGTELKSLNKTVGDIAAYKKAKQALGDLEKQQVQSKVAIDKQKTAIAQLKKEIKKGTQNEAMLEPEIQALQKLEKEHRDITSSTRDYERQIRQLGKALDQAGADVNALNKAESKALASIEKHNAALKKLKKEASDTSEFDRHRQELNKLDKQNKELTSSSNEYERELRRMKRSLSNAGIDVTDLSSEEAKLQSKVEKTTKALKEQTQALNKFGNASAQMEGLSDKLGMVGSIAAAAGYTLFRGDNMEKHMRMYAARTGTDMSSLMTEEQRKFRASLVADGATSGEIFTAMGLARTQGFDDKDTNALTAATVRLNQVFPDFDPQELTRAIGNTAKAFGVSIDEAAQRIAAIRQTTGDDNHDLLDTFAEYAPLLGDKVSLDQYSAVLTAGRQAGVWNYDKLGDSLKGSFQERFSDQGEFTKLVGGGNTVGAIEAITDDQERNNVRTAALRMRHAVNTGQGTDEAYAAFMQSLVPVMEKSPGVVKPILEAAGGTILSEDVGIKGLKAMIEALNNPDKFLHELNLKELAQSTRTKFEQGADAARSAQSVVDESTAGLIESQDGLSTAIQDLSKTFTDFVIENPSAGHASSAIETAAMAGGTLLLGRKLYKRFMGKSIDVAAGAAAENAADLSKASRFSKVAKFANKIPGLKHVPVIGTAIEGTMLAADVATGDNRGLWEDVGGIVGGALGGLAGTFVPVPGGMVAGGIGGDMAGREVGDWLYNVFNDEPEDVERVENLVSESSDTTARSTLPATPMIQIEYAPQISIQLTGASQEQAQALSDNIVTALRNMTPELEQQLRDAMSDIMQTSDYLEH